MPFGGEIEKETTSDMHDSCVRGRDMGNGKSSEAKCLLICAGTLFTSVIKLRSFSFGPTGPKMNCGLLKHYSNGKPVDSSGLLCFLMSSAK